MTNIREIQDLNNPELKIYTIRAEAQLLHFFEPAEGIVIAESPKVIRRALDAGYAPISALVEYDHIHNPNTEVEDVLSSLSDIPIYTAKADVLAEITGFRLTRGMLAAMRRKPLPPPSAICSDARRIAVLEDIVNPTNLGAIFRSAAALNVDAILLTPACTDPLYRRAARVSMGTVFMIPWTIADNVYDEVAALGFKTAAMALTDQSISLSNPAPARETKLAIILGTEGDGLKTRTIERSDYTIRIPMREGVDSLNVAAASAVAFWELCPSIIV